MPISYKVNEISTCCRNNNLNATKTMGQEVTREINQKSVEIVKHDKVLGQKSKVYNGRSQTLHR